MEWESIPATTRARTDKPALSIGRNGQIRWNRGFHEALGEPEYVELLVDMQNRRLGIRRAQEAQGSFAVHKASRQRTWGISAGGALRHKGIVSTHALRRWASDFGDGVWGISIEGLETEE